MRKLKLQLQVSADGYMGGPDGEMDWLGTPWDEELSAYVNAITEPVDTIVLGRKLAEGFIPHWAAGPEGEDEESAAWMTNTPKVVISRTLTESPWDNAVVENDVVEAITRLKAAPGGDIITYGGAGLVAGLLAEGLIDELHLLVEPTAIGKGLPVFPELDGPQYLRLVAARQFDCGITVMHYEPKRP
ncbi:dihydrofolate reductase family protein [Nonomuraea typhae]|uniref:Dihydrofolate reductase family protein n=1 Tax=Nonomuraea typhae TaxID=2603600 RepID=A0ABW7YWL6_9ACTN